MEKKECPFSGKTCGDWCRLFDNQKCVLERIETWLSAIAFAAENK
jgi:hypothetical protein